MMSKVCAILAQMGVRSSGEKRHLLSQALLFAHQGSRVKVRGQSSNCCRMKVVPSRQEHLNALKGEEFDVLVIGGGAVGCGCAVDAACRGLKTALIEADDFASGSSSRSSKLIDGSGSYLGTALREKDVEQLYIMLQMMSERVTMLKNAPHLNRIQPMVIPIYNVLSMPCTWLGLKLRISVARTFSPGRPPCTSFRCSKQRACAAAWSTTMARWTMPGCALL
ncbi:glycerol-3-phosphate dehydrogenase, mitochondrial isoform X2 [Drosophila gunungcola]|uniref:glycerol-3-phosphate dehydrogenase, mitochondrial isoform X2 n=1 Tax=Drosophila gunungcola TaxID=103775 RepID=UPI0022DFD360|nr:glycerol-3-phosphate dehydrogenase, mitochondrial isoform X2 [Drosophila gunungcola]